jgi:hypothetical protein
MNKNWRCLDLRAGHKDGAYEVVKKGPFKLPKWRRQLQTWRYSHKKTMTSLGGDGGCHVTNKAPAETAF